jgi:hypothetical protein
LKFNFQTNHPTVSNQKNGRESQFFSPLFGFSPTAQFQAKPHLVGNRASLYPTYCGDKKKMGKSYEKVTRTIFPNEFEGISASSLRKQQLVRRCEQKNQRDFLPRGGENFPDCFRCGGLNFRIGSTVFGRGFGTSTIGQPS